MQQPQPHEERTRAISAEDLAEHVRRIDRGRRKDMDALLTELLVHVYPTAGVQDA